MLKTSELESAISKTKGFSDLYFHYDEKLLASVIQPAYLKILIDFDRICRENNIQYNITAGTLLGAVREKGFIPWDDDIDVNVTPEGYARLKDAITLSKFDHEYEFILPEESKSVTVDGKFMSKNVSFGSLLNDPSIGNRLYLDVLRIENVPDNVVLLNVKSFLSKVLFVSHNSLRCYRKYDQLLNIMAETNPTLRLNLLIRKIVGFPAFLLGKATVIKIMESINSFDNDHTKQVSIPLGVKMYKGEIFNRDVFEKTVPIEFEGYYFQAPVGYEEYLTKRYGTNFMQRPPKKEQGIKCFQKRENWEDLYHARKKSDN